MSHSVGEIIDRAQRLSNRVDVSDRVRALQAVDRNVVYFSERLPWPSLEREETFYANGTTEFTFPQRVRRVISIGDASRQEYVAPGGEWARQYPTEVLGGTRRSGMLQWKDKGIVPVIQSPATDTTLQFTTTVSEIVTLQVKGLARDTTASGTSMEFFEKTESISLGPDTGSTSTTTEFVEVFSIEKDTVFTSGDIVATFAADSTPAARIQPNEQSPRYWRVEFLGKPAAGTQIKTRYYTRPPKISSESLILDPAIDLDFLEWRTAGDLHWINENGQAAQIAWEKADQMLETKITAKTTHGDRLSQAIPYAQFIDPEHEDIFG